MTSPDSNLSAGDVRERINYGRTSYVDGLGGEERIHATGPSEPI